MKKYVQYSTHNNFAAFIIDGNHHGFINKQRFFTISADGLKSKEQSVSPLTSNVETVGGLVQFMKKLFVGKFLLSQCHGEVVKGLKEDLTTSQCVDLL